MRSTLAARHPRILAPVLTAALLILAPAVVRAQNIALGKSAFQSSNYNDIAYAPSFAVDGTNLTKSITNLEMQAWWYVDLGGTFAVTGITLLNRIDCCPERLSNFNVSVLADGSTNIGVLGTPTVWTQFFSGAAGLTTAFTPPTNTNGRYVKVQLTGADYLQLAEVQVTGRAVTVGGPTNTVPEPGTTALLATGLAALGILVRRRHSVSA